MIADSTIASRTKLAYDYQNKWDPYHLRTGRFGTPLSDDEDCAEDESDEEDEQDSASKPEDESLGLTRGPEGSDMPEAGPGPSTVAQATEKTDKADKVDVGGKIQQKTLTAKIE